MSQSIFHVRPLDSGKGWAIDEYDGRGAWQHSVLKTPEGAPMDKQQAQRAVFQLRRKAVNSAPKSELVNKNRDANGTSSGPEDVKATPPSFTAQDLAREYIEEHYGYGPPQETVDELAAILERYAAGASAECRACDGRGWQVTDDDTANEVVQGTRECVVCEGSGIAS